MVQRCCVPLCDTKVGQVDVKGAKVRFHRIPLTPDKFLKWRQQITNHGHYTPELTVNSRICSKHFLREDYIVDDEQKPGTAGNHVLAKDAVPTIFKWTDEANATLSRAIPFIKKSELQNTLNGLSAAAGPKNQGVQCSGSAVHSLEVKKLKHELDRKNVVIRRLLDELDDHQVRSSSGSNNKGKSIGETQDSVKRKDEGTSVVVQTKEELHTSLPYLSKQTKSETFSIAHSPEMPTLTPSAFTPTMLPGHAVIKANTISRSSNTTVANFVTISTQTNNDTQDINCSGEESQPNNVVQRVSVIKRAGSSCSTRSRDILMPPKKRKLNYLYL
ncbi:uncharacterized protein LOC118433868 [Folsomia candida]|uniref:THAP domain-containing protein 1 n=1 Tax=Folsomia candida TaxID=158441 RepID=A0A226F1J6_FOLCA|nr:uncharacterized protein LOC118433868 [Folsomia candida]OXA63294.1 THAP domain-containing protein 1 [Folsomia candida]